MTEFKFFRGYIGTLNVMDGETYATASIHNPNTLWTPEESERQRIQRMETARYFQNETYGIHMERIRQERTIRRQTIEESEIPSVPIPSQSNDVGLSNYVPPIGESYYQKFFPHVTVTQVNPTFWTKVKIFGTRVKLVLIETWRAEPIGVVFVSALTAIVTIIMIAKILSIW